MEILPDTDIRILKNVPLDNTYEHTINFNTIQAQTNYFVGLTKHNLQRNTYQRYDKGIMRVEVRAEELYDCNYIMFRNTAFGSKWFYAFITSVEYVNNVTSKITYEIDVMQTWWFDFKVQQCFVEREHSATDVVGENLVEENLETGEYVFDLQTKKNTGHCNDWSVVLATTYDPDFILKPDSDGGLYGGIYTGLSYKAYSCDYDGLVELHNDMSNTKFKADGLVTLFMIPSDFVIEKNNYWIDSLIKHYTINNAKDFTEIKGHRVRNKKLLTYPYNFLHVVDGYGNSGDYRYEFFDYTAYSTASFEMYGDMNPNSSLCIVPLHYKGLAENYNEKMNMGEMPQCGFNADTYKAYVAQQASSTGVSMIATALAGGVGGAMATKGTMLSAGSGFKSGFKESLGGIGQISSLLGSLGKSVIVPPQAKGGNSSNIALSMKRYDFEFCRTTITKEFAEIIDDYFDKYGYATHTVKVPNRNVRPHWTYTKTVGATITGSVPADDMHKICSIYDNGITFWNNGSEVGNYSLNNEV